MPRLSEFHALENLTEEPAEDRLKEQTFSFYPILSSLSGSII